MSMNKARSKRLLRLVDRELKIYPAPLSRNDKASRVAFEMAKALKVAFAPLEDMIERLNSSSESMLERFEELRKAARVGGAE